MVVCFQDMRKLEIHGCYQKLSSVLGLTRSKTASLFKGTVTSDLPFFVNFEHLKTKTWFMFN